MAATLPGHSAEDLKIVAAQLGREPRGRWTVAVRCHLGVPMVIENHPRLEDGSPFPTLFWLTCPILIKRVGHLEMEGAMKALNELLAADEALRARLQDAIDRTKARRDSYEVIEDSGAPPGGGTDRIKCLHAHTAQELALAPNPVGALALAGTGWPDCLEPCFALDNDDPGEPG